MRSAQEGRLLAIRSVQTLEAAPTSADISVCQEVAQQGRNGEDEEILW